MSKNNVNYVPEGRNSVTPYLIVKGAGKSQRARQTSVLRISLRVP